MKKIILLLMLISLTSYGQSSLTKAERYLERALITKNKSSETLNSVSKNKQVEKEANNQIENVLKEEEKLRQDYYHSTIESKKAKTTAKRSETESKFALYEAKKALFESEKKAFETKKELTATKKRLQFQTADEKEAKLYLDQAYKNKSNYYNLMILAENELKEVSIEYQEALIAKDAANSALQTAETLKTQTDTALAIAQNERDKADLARETAQKLEDALLIQLNKTDASREKTITQMFTVISAHGLSASLSKFKNQTPKDIAWANALKLEALKIQSKLKPEDIEQIQAIDELIVLINEYIAIYKDYLVILDDYNAAVAACEQAEKDYLAALAIYETKLQEYNEALILYQIKLDEYNLKMEEYEATKDKYEKEILAFELAKKNYLDAQKEYNEANLTYQKIKSGIRKTKVELNKNEEILISHEQNVSEAEDLTKEAKKSISEAEIAAKKAKKTETEHNNNKNAIQKHQSSSRKLLYEYRKTVRGY